MKGRVQAVWLGNAVQKAEHTQDCMWGISAVNSVNIPNAVPSCALCQGGRLPMRLGLITEPPWE